MSLGAYTERFCSMKDTICQVRSRHIQRRIVPSDTRRDPGPRRVDHLHHHTPVTVSNKGVGSFVYEVQSSITKESAQQ